MIADCQREFHLSLSNFVCSTATVGIAGPPRLRFEAILLPRAHCHNLGWPTRTEEPWRIVFLSRWSASAVGRIDPEGDGGSRWSCSEVGRHIVWENLASFASLGSQHAFASLGNLFKERLVRLHVKETLVCWHLETASYFATTSLMFKTWITMRSLSIRFEWLQVVGDFPSNLIVYLQDIWVYNLHSDDNI